MKNNLTSFVAYLEQDNLGVGYIASILMQNGVKVKIIDFRLGRENILKQIKNSNPNVIGFSIIFQYHIYEFRDLIKYLRRNGIDCHFSAGGHYPSLRYKELLGIIPELDSVILFEGEHTFLELVQAVNSNQKWKNILGIAYKNNNSITVNKLRPLENDLDNFPLPIRQPLKEYTLGKKYATIIAGRGCYYNCSFCSIREFYSKPPGDIKRIRRPEMVVREMELLYQKLDCSIFMFQDDDFPVALAKGKEWITKFCNLLILKGLNDKILWKINCRPDEIEKELFKLMRKAGLFLVYLGIESGTDEGLLLMNKHMTTKTSIGAINILKELDILYDFGFMLLHPNTTFQSIRENLDFLNQICSDGSSPITFCKMLPYAETKIEYLLIKEKRLKGEPGFKDYDFINSSLNHLYAFIKECFRDWISNHDGLLNIARWVRYYLSIYNKYYQLDPNINCMNKEVMKCISESNVFFLNTIKKLVNIYEEQRYEKVHSSELNKIRKSVKEKHSEYRNKLIMIMDNIDNMATIT
jgi:radical SAM superfamily enzyme YgiQ (UPF0313 family)